jgi:hypothetical protein
MVPGYPELRYPTRNTIPKFPHPIQHYILFNILALATQTDVFNQAEPPSLAAAKVSFFWKRWLEAMTLEHNSLVENKTYELVDCIPGMNVLRGKWIYKLKRGPNNEVLRYKARWVVRGFEQIEGVDYFETFASVVKPMSYKILFAIAAAMDLEIEQMDVVTAFLYGDVEEQIYVEQPLEFNDKTGRVCKLKKALYGLKQAPRVWFKTLTDFLYSLGFAPITSDCGVYAKGGVFIAIYVDDLLIVGKDKKVI